MILTGTEPKHWHRTTEDGKLVHALGDPRKDGIPKRDWDADTKRYVAHLEECEALYDPARLAPIERDFALTTMLFELLAAKERETAKLRKIIIAIRQAQDQGKTEAEVKKMFAPPPGPTGEHETA